MRNPDALKAIKRPICRFFEIVNCYRDDRRIRNKFHVVERAPNKPPVGKEPGDRMPIMAKVMHHEPPLSLKKEREKPLPCGIAWAKKKIETTPDPSLEKKDGNPMNSPPP